MLVYQRVSHMIPYFLVDMMMLVVMDSHEQTFF